MECFKGIMMFTELLFENFVMISIIAFGVMYYFVFIELYPLLVKHEQPSENNVVHDHPETLYEFLDRNGMSLENHNEVRAMESEVIKLLREPRFAPIHKAMKREPLPSRNLLIDNRSVLHSGDNSTVKFGSFNHLDVTVKMVKLKSYRLKELGEACILAILQLSNAPNVPLYYGSYIQFNTLYLISERMDMALDKYMAAERAPDWSQRLGYLRDVTNALKFMHGLGLVHRDIKPENVLLKEGGAKLSDFGLSGINNYRKGIIGTLLWMAPEVMKSKSLTTKADIYSLAMLANAIANWVDDLLPHLLNMGELSSYIIKGNRPSIPPDCPENVVQFITMGWMAKPGKRPHASQMMDLISPSPSPSII